jgi:predicted DNA binding CopG/RHH family protein
MEKMKNYKLDAEEQKILNSFENDEWISILTPERIAKIEQIAKNTSQKTKHINIRMTERDRAFFYA